MPAALWLLAACRVFTVGQRIAHVYRQAGRPSWAWTREGGRVDGATRGRPPGREAAGALVTPIEFGYVAGWRLVRALPQPVAAAVFRAGADRAYRRRGRGTPARRQPAPRGRPGAARGRVRRAGAAGLRSYARYWLEVFRLPSLSREQILRGFRLDGEDEFVRAVAAGRGVVVALPHAGNWDAAGAWVAAHGWPLTTVAERLKPEGLYQRFVAFRNRLGMEIIPITGSERPPIDLLTERLRAGVRGAAAGRPGPVRPRESR